MPTNRLIHEKSPYLLQHAHNPVDWYPWGEEAFARARAEDKPIFLSVGYSTCHWCHVMEKECFEDEAIADLLNRYFVPVKVDREERPDVDRTYMLFVQAATGTGGWPLSVWLTPELKPFFGGTYFPPEDRYGRPGFGTVLAQIASLWQRDRERIRAAGESITEQLRQQVQAELAPDKVDEDALERGFFYFRRTFDTVYGGFGGAPKFPRPAVIYFLLREYARTGNREALEMCLHTLEAMAQGRIHDWVGGGFHRYTVDEAWQIPHYEKMLYDQAQLAVAYLEGFQASGEENLAGVARGILDYVLRDMQAPEGGFYSAEDADSSPDPERPELKLEGAFYQWPEELLEQALQDPASKQELLELRAQRPRPERDDKILAAWNGLMISALSLGASVLGDERYLEAAQRAAGFVLDQMYDPGRGILFRRYREGESGIEGFLEDYACMAQGLLDLYEASFRPEYLVWALRLTERQIELFEDADAGGFLPVARGQESQILPLKDTDDGAEPSGNSVAAINLLRLALYTGRKDLREKAERTFEAFGRVLRAAPGALPYMLAALGWSRSSPQQIVIAGDPKQADTRQLLGLVRRRFMPYKALIVVDGGTQQEALAEIVPEAAAIRQVGGKATAYVCQEFACQEPATEPEQLEELLNGGERPT